VESVKRSPLLDEMSRFESSGLLREKRGKTADLIFANWIYFIYY